MEDDLKTFNRYWECKHNKINVYDIPEAVERELIKIAPNNIADLKLDKKMEVKGKSGKKLWDHQIEAIDKWIENEMNSIFEMATGTGKTFTALGCLNELLKKENKLICIIACPYAHLIDQWIEDVNDFGFQEDIVVAYSGNQKWKRELNDYIFDINRISTKPLFLIFV